MRRVLARRVDDLERAAESRRPVQPTVVIIRHRDGTASVGGQAYASESEARDANPSPSGLHVVVQTACRRRPEPAPGPEAA